MSGVNPQQFTEREARVAEALRVLGHPDKPIEIQELHARLVRRLASKAVSLKTLERAAEGKSLSWRTAVQIASEAGGDPEWYVAGGGSPPRTDKAPPVRPATARTVLTLPQGSPSQGTPPTSLEEAYTMAAAAIASAIRWTIERDNEEIPRGRQGRELMIDWLTRTAQEFRAHGADVSDIFLVRDALRDGRV